MPRRPPQPPAPSHRNPTPGRRRNAATLVALSLAMAVTVTACGDDEEASPTVTYPLPRSTTTAPRPESAAEEGAYVALDVSAVGGVKASAPPSGTAAIQGKSAPQSAYRLVARHGRRSAEPGRGGSRVRHHVSTSCRRLNPTACADQCPTSGGLADRPLGRFRLDLPLRRLGLHGRRLRSDRGTTRVVAVSSMINSLRALCAIRFRCQRVLLGVSIS